MNRLSLTGTPSDDSFLAYVSPSSLRISTSAVNTIAEASPLTDFAFIGINSATGGSIAGLVEGGGGASFRLEGASRRTASRPEGGLVLYYSRYTMDTDSWGSRTNRH